MRRAFFTGLPVLTALLAGCAGLPSGPGPGIATVDEVFQTERVEADDVDSPAVWHGPAGQHWLLATTKRTHQLLVHDAATGATLQRIGGFGAGEGQFSRPNGISVHGDLVFVVERDNHRVQVLGLPDFRPLGHFGGAELVKPYGLWVEGTGVSGTVWVTDNHDLGPERGLDHRLHRFRWDLADGRITGRHAGSFGDTTGPGTLDVVESVFGDPAHDRLLLSEEDLNQSCLKVYDLKGAYGGRDAGRGVFTSQVEGIALWDQGAGTGWWVVSDQDKQHNCFRVFDRVSLDYLGAFRGPLTSNTDGVWLTPVAFGPFPSGAFFAVHDDGNVSAFDLGAIAVALGLKLD